MGNGYRFARYRRIKTFSKYLIETAKEHIEGTIDIEEVKIRIDEYYEVQGSRKNFEKRK